MRRLAAATAAVLLVSTAPSAARAQDAATLGSAKMLFNAGAQAYDLAHYDVAMQAFEAAYAKVPRPAILFAIAQAARKQWVATQQAEALRIAVDRYRAYLAAEKNGTRAAEAVTALAELQPSLDVRLKGGAMPAAPAMPAGEATPTRIMVSVEAPGATVALDGAPPRPAPLMADVTAGAHRVTISAPGFFDEQHDVAAVASTLVPFDFSPAERPAIAHVVALDGSDVSVDGRPVGTTPFLRPLEVVPGAHLVVVTRRGYQAFSYTGAFARGQTVDVDVTYEHTTQRVASYVLFGATGAAVITGGVFVALAVSAQSQAQGILGRKAQGTLSGADLASYDSDVNSRGEWKTAAQLAFASGAALLATGAILYLFDTPTLGPVARPEPTPKPEPERQMPSMQMQMGAAPVVGPGFYGAALGGRF